MKVSALKAGAVAGLFVQLLAVAPAFSSEIAPSSLMIRSLSVAGTNLVLAATIPAGLENVTLEMRRSPDSRWEAVEQLNAPAGGDTLFTIPKPAGAMCLFRLNGRPQLSAANSELLSPELDYVAMPSLALNTLGGDAVFHFKGRVDGSDRILITRDGAWWNHVNWDWPSGPVTVNGTAWTPAEKNYVTAVGALRFLPETFSLDDVTLENVAGRDIVALERTGGALLVYLDDTPSGADEYEFEIHFHPAAKIADGGGTPPALLKIAARIDGSDCVRITRQEAVWEHKNYEIPQHVSVNGISWDVGQTNVLSNQGETAFLPAGVDFSTAKILSRKGRDVATLWAEKESLLVTFADNPNGSDDYELEISFGKDQTK